MYAYVFNKETHAKIATFKKVDKIVSEDGVFIFHVDGEIIVVEKDNIKVVVYGF